MLAWIARNAPVELNSVPCRNLSRVYARCRRHSAGDLPREWPKSDRSVRVWGNRTPFVFGV